MKILIADDDTMARHLLERTLSTWGYEVVAVSDGSQAWDILQGESPPPAAILDWMMPGMTGIEVCRQARAAGGAAGGTYLIMVTSRDQKADIVEALRAGADDFVTKPFFPEELRARVQAGERIITLQQSSGPPAGQAAAGAPANLRLLQANPEWPELLAADRGVHPRAVRDDIQP